MAQYNPGFNKMEWRPRAMCAPYNTAIPHAAGTSICGDMRNNETRIPSLFYVASATTLYRYDIKPDGWQALLSPALGGTFGAGARAEYMPSMGPRGTITTGATTTTIPTSSLITSVAVNQFADRSGGFRGHRVRIIGKTAGKTEEVEIIGNTAGTTPTLYLGSALSFTPTSGDQYEILSGRVYMTSAGTTAAGTWKYYDLATNTMSGNLSITNLPNMATDTNMLVLDELYTPFDRAPGEGFFGILTATGTGASALTGSIAGTDAVTIANEYRNFQIRIVEDTTTPLAVGQRKIISTHTGGASPVYTLSSAWTNTPSTNAKYVIEYPNLIVLWTGGQTNTHVYNPTPAAIVNAAGTSLAADAWSVTYFAARGTTIAAGAVAIPCFGIEPDAQRQGRHSHIWSFRGGNTVNLDLFDIAGATTGAWTNAITYNGNNYLFTTGCSGCYSPYTHDGRYAYINMQNTNNFQRFDIYDRSLAAMPQLRYPQAGTAAVGQRMASVLVYHGTDKYEMLIFQGHTTGYFWDLVVINLEN